jgi:PAS domain-containing protein
MEYINKIIKEALKNIKSEEDRKFLRELSISLIPQLTNDFSEKLNEIIKEVDNLFPAGENYIYTVPVNEEELENYRDTLFPLLKDDIKKLKTKEKREDIFLKKVFLDMSYEEIENFKNHKLKIKSKSNKEYYNAEVYMVQCQSYTDKEKELLEVFRSNDIDWEVLYTPYSRKFFDIYVKKIPDETDINIEDITIDYGNYTESIYENYFLAWNLEEKKVLADQVAVESTGNQIYEYRVFSSNAKNDLVKIKNGEILRINREIEKLFIYSDVINIKNWELWNIKNLENKTYDNLRFKVQGNRKENDFITRFKGSSASRTRSKSEIHEIVNSFSDIKKLKLKRVTVNEYTEKTSASFDMNVVFNERKTFKRENMEKLNLYFECIDKDKYFEDELSFILSCVEYKYPEYEVKGIIK